MSNVNLNFGPIETNGLPAIDNACTHINEALSFLKQSNIPGDFYRYQLLVNSITDLENQVKSLRNLKTWLVDSNNNYNSMIDKLEVQAHKMPIDCLKRRNTII